MSRRENGDLEWAINGLYRKEENFLAEKLLSIVLSLALVPWFGFVFSQGWGWFVQPLNASIPALSVFHAAGLVFLVNVISWSANVQVTEIKEKVDPSDWTASAIFGRKAGMAFALLLAWGYMWGLHSLA